ncbi:copper amine oxidase N-terminal domain-containing protein [Paenibacillus turpanensis]|uniref:copper amine oxidase N-terminal domain-containing protein n=1 Tax=Paenibacillus turpanensis TaxID=2689078 RepID=UPI00140BD133|nr:copper amine oxidase N-terminal domain-containing protein [Paenibacillus turpanensis]
MPKSWKVWLSGVLALLLVVLTGCEAVNGFDVNKALTASTKMQNYEGSFKMSLKLDVNEKAFDGADEQAEKMLKLFQSVTFNVTSMKALDRQNASLKGTLEFGKGSIPFEAVTNSEKLLFTAEGMKKPIEVPLFGLSGIPAEQAAAMPFDIKALQEAALKHTDEYIAAVSGLFVENLPNPNVISVEKVSEQVHGETVSLHKLHAEVYGTEFVKLGKEFIVSVLKDEEGIKELLSVLYDMMLPMLNDLAKNEEIAQSEAGAMLSTVLADKTLAIDLAYTQIKMLTDQLLVDIDAKLAEAEENFPLDENTYIKSNMYFDEDMNPRKSNFEFVMKPKKGEAKESDDLRSITLTMEDEYWNLGKVTAIDTIEGEPYTIDEENATPEHFLENIDKKSLLYDFLKNDLKITKRSLTLMLDEEDTGYTSPFTPYIKGQGTTMVPTRMISERLGAKVTWDGVKQQVTVKDFNGTTIELVVGSKTATVNGNAVELPEAPDNYEGTTFVPVAFIADVLGAEVNWTPETRTVEITKE